jgi:transporter family protein
MWILLGLLSALTAALMTVVGKTALANVDPTLATGIRSAVMCAAMAAVLAATGKWRLAEGLPGNAWTAIVVSALFGAASWLCYFLALRIAPAAKVAALDRLSLAMVVVLAALFLGEAPSWKTGLGALLSTAGILLIVRG